MWSPRLPPSAIPRSFFPVLVLIGSSACDRAPAPLANSAKAGLFCASIEEVFRLPDDEIDLGTAALLVCREIAPEIDVLALQGEIDELAQECRRSLLGDDEERRVEQLIRDVSGPVRGRGPIVFEGNTNLVHRLIETRRGNCLGISMLYLAVGERVDLPLLAVFVPGHCLVRYEGEDRPIDIETTTSELVSGGRDPSDYYFFSEEQRRSFEEAPVATVRATLAHYVSEVAAGQLEALGCARALELCELGIANLPDQPSGYRFKAELSRECDCPEEGIASVRRALEVGPYDGDSWALLATLLSQLGRHEEALDAIWRAIELDSTYPPFWLVRAEILGEQGDCEPAIDAAEFALDLRVEELHPLRRQMVRKSLGEPYEEFAFRLLADAHLELADEESTKQGDLVARHHALDRAGRHLALASLYRSLQLVRSSPDRGWTYLEIAVDTVSSQPSYGEDERISELMRLARDRYDAPPGPD